MEPSRVQEETRCCCCGRDIPASAAKQVDREGFERPWVFCRRCYAAVPWREASRMTGKPGPNGQPAKAD